MAKVRGSGNEAISAIRRLQRELLPDLPPTTVFRVEDVVRRATADYRARTLVLGMLVGLCLPVAVAGIAGALLHATRRRSREVGIRLALGANRGHIRRGVVVEALRHLAAGIGIGLLGGVAAGRWMSAYLFGISPADAVSIAAATTLLLVIGLAAALWPAWRASAIDPAVVLRDA